MKMRPWIIIAFLVAATLRAQDELPKRAPGDGLDFEPKLMLDGPHAAIVDPSPAPQSPADRVARLEAELLQAEQRAADSEQLYKEGVLAKIEAEGRVLRVIQARKQLADARLVVAAAQADAVKKSFAAHQSSQADLAAANAALDAARQAAAAASDEWEKAELDAAILDLSRKKKLYSEGVGTRREVEVAEDRVALLTGTATK